MSSGRSSRQAKCRRTIEGLGEDEGHLWKGLPELPVEVRKEKAWCCWRIGG